MALNQKVWQNTPPKSRHPISKYNLKSLKNKKIDPKKVQKVKNKHIQVAEAGFGGPLWG